MGRKMNMLGWQCNCHPNNVPFQIIYDLFIL